jgi:hypothetical protein
MDLPAGLPAPKLDRASDAPRTVPALRARAWRTSPAQASLALSLLGLFFAVLNGDLPIVRNALLYAQIAKSLLAHGMRLWTVCGDPSLVFNKPCGFAAIAAPLVGVFGINTGLVCASVAGGVLLVLSTWSFLRRFNPRFQLDDRAIPLELALCFFNPLLIYQFWSGYSDACFSAGFLFSFVVLDRLIREPARLHWAATYFASFVFCTLMKHGSVMMLPLHAAYLLWHKAELRQQWQVQRPQLLALAVAVLCSAVFLILGRLGVNPLLNLEVNRGQLSGDVNYAMNVKVVIVFLFITLSTWLLLLPRISVTIPNAALLTVLILNVHLLTTYRGSAYNTRYYITASPILAMYLVRAHATLRSALVRRGFLVSFLVLNALSILTFNQRAVYRWVTAQLPSIGFGATSYFDCLRMGDHLESLELIDGVNGQLPTGARLLHVSSYYGGGGFGVYEQAGFFRPDLQISYRQALTEQELEPLALAGTYVMYPPPFPAEPLNGMQALGPRLFRIPNRPMDVRPSDTIPTPRR